MSINYHIHLVSFLIIIQPLLLPMLEVGDRRLFCRIFGPYMRNAMGIGIIRAAIHPSSVPAHCTPRFSNICLEKSGKQAPTRDRSIVLAAKADAAL